MYPMSGLAMLSPRRSRHRASSSASKADTPPSSSPRNTAPQKKSPHSPRDGSPVAVEDELSFAVVDSAPQEAGGKRHSPFADYLLATQLVESFLQEKCVPAAKPSLKEQVSKNFPVQGRPGRLHFHSLSGYTGELLRMRLERIDLMIIVFSITTPDSLLGAKGWLPILREMAPYLPVLLVGDHVDQRERSDKSSSYVQRQEGQECARQLAAYDYIECTTIQYHGVTRVFELAINYALQGRTRQLPTFSRSEAQAKKEFQSAISQFVCHPNDPEMGKRFDKLLRKHVQKAQKGRSRVDLSGLNLLEQSVDVILPRILSSSVCQLTIELDLSFNRLSRVPREVLASTGRVVWLSVEGNQIHRLSAELVDLEKLLWKGNPLSSVISTFRNDYDNWEQMRGYLSSLFEDAAPWKEMKVLLVGEEGVGKTTLRKCLQSPKHKADTKENLSTDGVHVTRTLQLDADSPVHFNVWDLGGQEVFYPTHQFFLTSNSIYLLVFDLRTASHARVEYWMRLIRTISQNSRRAPIFMVGTHVDDSSLDEQTLTARLTHVSETFLPSSFRGLQTIHAVSCKTGAGIAELKKGILDVSCAPWFQQEVALSWHRLSQMVTSKRESGIDKVAWSVYRSWSEVAEVAPAELDACTKFLHDVGHLIYFDEKRRTNEQDRPNLVVLDPQWLANVMSSLITFRHKWVRNGRIHMNPLRQHVFLSYPSQLHDELITLLERFSVIYRSKADPDIIIVPSFLEEQLDEQQQQLADQFWPEQTPEGMIPYGRIYRFPFLPIGFFEKIIVRVIHSPTICSVLLWRSGLLCSVEEQSIKMVYDVDENTFALYVREPFTYSYADTRPLALREIVDAVETLIECFYRIEVERLIPCTHCLQAGVQEPTLFPYHDVVEAILADSQLVCQGEHPVKLSVLAPDIAFSDMVIISPDDLQMGQKLGEGGFGTVYLGTYQGSPVAVKELLTKKDEIEGTELFQSFQQEAFVMSCLEHPNVVKLYGICIKPCLRMVLELVPCGDLFDLLHPKDPESGERGQIARWNFPWELRLRLAYDIAMGMQYLQSFSPPIVHRDLRSPNIFLTSVNAKHEVCAKVADFGLSRMVAPTLGGALGTWQWLAPEVFSATDTDRYDERADCFSFGIICWELATRQFPYAEYETNPKYALQRPDGTWEMNVLTVKQAIVDGLRPTFPPSREGVPLSFQRLIQRCWDSDPARRPKFDEIVNEIRSLFTPAFLPFLPGGAAHLKGMKIDKRKSRSEERKLASSRGLLVNSTKRFTGLFKRSSVQN